MLVVRGQSNEAEYTRLTGKTSRGQVVGLTLLDGRLQSFNVHPAGWCRPQSTWVPWKWHAVEGFRAEFDQEGSAFHARERGQEYTLRWVADLRGELGDEGESARGTVSTRWVDGETVCQGTVSFRARKRS